MSKTHVRLLYPSSVRPEEVRAAMAGIRRFESFGVEHDSIEIYRPNFTPVRHVKRGERIHEIITATETQFVAPSLLRTESPWALVYDKHMIGLGLTDSSLYVDREIHSRPIYMPLMGMAMEGAAAIVSISKIRREHPELSDMAIETAVVHELGHVFIESKAHCTTPSCIMQANENYLDFIERFVKARLDFCRLCREEVQLNVNSIQMRDFA